MQSARTALPPGGLVVVALLVASCSSALEARFPEHQGLLVAQELSPDLEFNGESLGDFEIGGLVNGSVDVRLADGTEFRVTEDTTILQSLCYQLRPSVGIEPGRCWLQVGPATESGHVAWLRPIAAGGVSQLVDPGGGTVREVTATAIIFKHGLVVYLGEEAPELDPSCDGSPNDLTFLEGQYARTALDLDTGNVAEVTCKPLPRD